MYCYPIHDFSLHPRRPILEHKVESEPYSVLRYARHVCVCEASNIINLQTFEDVMHTHHKLQVRVTGHDVCPFRELIQFRVIDILRQVRVVLVRQVAPHALESKVFTPLQLLYQWQTVEEFSLQVPCKIELCLSVVEEFQALHEVESLKMLKVRGVHRWRNEERERHFVPLCTRLQTCVNMSPAAQPETFIH